MSTCFAAAKPASSLTPGESVGLFNSDAWQAIIGEVYGYTACELPERLRGVTPAFRVNSWLFGPKITNMPFNFFPELAGSREKVREALEWFAALCAAQPKLYAELKLLRPLPEDSLLPGWEVQHPFVHSKISLSGGLDAVYARAGRNLEKNLRRVRNGHMRHGVRIACAEVIGEVQAFHRLLVRVYRDRHRMLCHPRHLYETLHRRGLARFYLSWQEETLAGGVVILQSSRRWYYAWGAAAPDALRLGTSLVLLDRAIRDALDAGVTEFDFGTSSPSDAGLLEFKRRWGCVTSLTQYYYHAGRGRVRTPDFDASFPALRKLYGFLPVGVITRLLPRLVPQFG